MTSTETIGPDLKGEPIIEGDDTVPLRDAEKGRYLRFNALDLAMRTATGGESAERTLMRAEAFYKFICADGQ